MTPFLLLRSQREKVEEDSQLKYSRNLPTCSSQKKKKEKKIYISSNNEGRWNTKSKLNVEKKIKEYKILSMSDTFTYGDC